MHLSLNDFSSSSCIISFISSAESPCSFMFFMAVSQTDGTRSLRSFDVFPPWRCGNTWMQTSWRCSHWLTNHVYWLSLWMQWRGGSVFHTASGFWFVLETLSVTCHVLELKGGSVSLFIWLICFSLVPHVLHLAHPFILSYCVLIRVCVELNRFI